MKHLLTIFTAFVILVGQSLAADKPNVVFILADDLGIGNVGCYGADNYKTLHIDKLAADGMRFTHCFTAALCGPSRAMIMTGRYAFRNGSSNQDACTVMPNKELQLGRVFQSAGYKTASIGKWGQLPGDPDESGFDDYLRFNGSGVYRNKKEGKAEEYLVNGKEMKLGDNEYMPDLMHEHMMEFIKKHKDEPFFVYYPMSSVHGDLLPTPDSAPNSQDLMADNVAYMDKLVGKLVAELDALKLRENTLIIFMGDNGTGKGQSEPATISGKALSGMKGTMLECGGLVPMIANWPAKMPAGKVSADLIDSTDFLPTFAELTGGSLPKDTIFDGRSIAPQLRGEAGTPREWVYNQLAAMWYVRDANWKLNEKGELFDMSDAPFTEKIVTGDHPARTKLAAVLAKLNPAGGIPDSGDGTGRHANKDKKKKEGDKKPEMTPKTTATPPATTMSAEEQERAGKFDKLDKDKAGKITREYFMTHQSDAAAAGERFDKNDTDKDGLLSREEYIFKGKKVNK